MSSEFRAWLGAQLRAWAADEAVLGDYVVALLESEGEVGELGEEAGEALADVLAGALPPGEAAALPGRVAAVLARWASRSRAEPAAAPAPPVEDRLVQLLRPEPAPAAARQRTDDERRLRDSILQQYGTLQLDDEDQDVGGGDDDDLGRNTNAATVAAAARERREHAKQESQRKRDKDKEDREKQKQLKEEKKEKRKTQKGERKR